MSSTDKLMAKGIPIFFGAAIFSLCVFYIYKDFKRENELCKNGNRTFGLVYRLEEDNNNEANIHSWYAFYRFEGVGRSYWGQISVSKNKKIKVGDSVNVIHFKEDPNDHEASFEKFNTDCLDPSISSFLKDNVMLILFTIAGGLGVLLFIISQRKDTTST